MCSLKMIIYQLGRKKEIFSKLVIERIETINNLQNSIAFNNLMYLILKAGWMKFKSKLSNKSMGGKNCEILQCARPGLLTL